jgi:hypothetical protein
MDSEAFSLQQMKLRAFDLSDRAIRRGGASAVRRVERWRRRAFMIAQCSITAGLAWLLASQLPGHKLPFFAPVAAVITLGLSFGRRLRRAVEVAIGVAVASRSAIYGSPYSALAFGRSLRSPPLRCRSHLLSRPADDDPGGRAVDHRDSAGAHFGYG